MTEKSEKQRILIVDDSPENIDILAEALDDYELSIALNGEEALELARSEDTPDLILLDIVMPGMDGYQVCEELKSDEKTMEIPVIFLTAKTESDSVVKGFSIGAVDYVTKPFKISELLARVTTQMLLKKSQDANAQYLKEIELQNQLITNSISDASRLQNASLPFDNYLSEILDEYFIINKPKDIVSGDFYWIRKIDNKVIVIAADCTGHGVPGAFMSIFGISFLNEIIGKDSITQPAEILTRLRDMVVASLQQDLGTNVKDGMDMAVLAINSSTETCEFAGAMNPLYFVCNKNLTVISPDRNPVSIYDEMNPFTNHVFEFGKGDQVYLFSDGFADQFGGPKRKKFKYENFKKLITDHSNKPMADQKKVFEKTFIEWKGVEEQIDDVLLLGIKL